MNPESAPPDLDPRDGSSGDVDDEDTRGGAGFKLLLVLAPFVLVVALGILEWWIRSRGT